MAENFTIEVDYNGDQQSFTGELRKLGYTHKLFIDVNGVEVVFEPDEERNYRVIITNHHDADKFDKGLLQKIVDELKHITMP